MQTLIDVFMSPACAPDVPYTPASDVVSWSPTSDAGVIAEVFVRPGATFGIRCSVWVAWRDAGNNIRSHSWWHLSPSDALITDTLSEAQARVSSFLDSKNIHIAGQWHAA